MLRLAADENLKAAIVAGLRRLQADLDILTVQEAGRTSQTDPEVLDWAASEQRILITHDTSTMIQSAYDRSRAGDPMPGLLVVPSSFPIGRAVDEIALFATASVDGEWDGQVVYVPLR